MDETEIQQIVDRVVRAIEGLAPASQRGPDWWEPWAAFGSYAALLAALVAFVIGSRSLAQQRKALRVTVRSDARNLRQKREADARSEWWRRTQWALEAASSDNTALYGYGAGMLDLLAKSELAGPKDKELLDAVWEVTSTEMEPEGIRQLLEDARTQDGLTYEEMASLLSYDDATVAALDSLKEQAQGLTYEDLAAMLAVYSAPITEPEPENVDADSGPGPRPASDSGDSNDEATRVLERREKSNHQRDDGPDEESLDVNSVPTGDGQLPTKSPRRPGWAAVGRFGGRSARGKR